MKIEYEDLIGTPFQYGGRGEGYFDCYGLVIELYRRQGIAIPDYLSPTDAPTIAALMGNQIILWTKVQPQVGSMMLIRVGQLYWHVGLYLGDDKFIHTSKKTGGVCVERLSLWARKIEGFYVYQR